MKESVTFDLHLDGTTTVELRDTRIGGHDVFDLVVSPEEMGDEPPVTITINEGQLRILAARIAHVLDTTTTRITIAPSSDRNLAREYALWLRGVNLGAARGV